MQNALARVRNPSLRQGLVFGIILGFILLAISVIGFGSLIIIWILCFLAAFLAGYRASQGTGRIVTGTIAGLWTGLIGTFIPYFILSSINLINIDAYRKSLHITTNSTLIEFLLIYFVLLLFLGVLIGVCGGAIGGVIGRNRAQPPPPEEYKEAMFEPPNTATPEGQSTQPASEEPALTSEAEDTQTEHSPEEVPTATPTQEPSTNQQTE